MMKYLKSSEEAKLRRKRAESSGQHIPPFLIASITTKCNLHCKGCYARANHNCFDADEHMPRMLSTQKWDDIFTEAEELGISFILLAGGEPMLRTDVMKVAGLHRKILFPVFTNGTPCLTKNLNDASDNTILYPTLVLRGEEVYPKIKEEVGTYERLIQGMASLKRRGIVFGSSITVQKDNMSEVMSAEFLEKLIGRGCKTVIYVEYVPVNKETSALAPDDQDRVYMTERLAFLRKQYPQMVFISFPGDEKTSGGCLAAGRGFFHINAYGSAEPCPFSAYSDTSLA
jgi:MoaA/NifB/PqqE/SkfB family radical SAM enzyme